MNVEVDAPAKEDLSAILASIREHYETVASKNRRDMENWFQAKVGPCSAGFSVEFLQVCSLPASPPARRMN